jgi:hypothetical protein
VSHAEDGLPAAHPRFHLADIVYVAASVARARAQCSVWLVRLKIGVPSIVLVLTSPGCGTSCQEIVAEYINGLAYAKSCDPAASGPCSVQLPVPESMEDTDGNLTPENLAGTCTTSFNPAHSGQLQALYSQYQSQGCKFGVPPICGDSSTAQCLVIPESFGGDGGYTCVDGVGIE